jgi:hypothetical protein
MVVDWGVYGKTQLFAPANMFLLARAGDASEINWRLAGSLTVRSTGYHFGIVRPVVPVAFL